MPRYFFHLFDDLDATEEEGCQLPDLKAAQAMGVNHARSLAAEQVLAGKLHLGHRIEIADARGRVLATIPFANAFEIVA